MKEILNEIVEKHLKEYKREILVNLKKEIDAKLNNMDKPAKGQLTDPDGNEYTTVVIGDQEWTVENWRSTKYADGTPISKVTDSDEWSSLNTPAYCWYDNTTNELFRAKYGALYNWYVISPDNPKDLAPDGWRVPTDADWEELEDYMIANGYNWGGSTTYNKIGKALASDGGEWRSTSDKGGVGNDQSSNNSSGFSALPGGYRRNDGYFSSLIYRGYWWSVPRVNVPDANSRSLNCIYECLRRSHYSKEYGFSVRLVRDVR